jgi:hypothetical protein
MWVWLALAECRVFDTMQIVDLWIQDHLHRDPIEKTNGGMEHHQVKSPDLLDPLDIKLNVIFAYRNLLCGAKIVKWYFGP